MKVKLLICLTMILLSLSVIRGVESANYSFLSQDYAVGQWGQNNIYIVWIEEQIKAILDQFEEAGLQFPAELKDNLKALFTDLLDSLRNKGMVMPYLGKALLNISPYNITFNYDLVNNLTDFKANNIITDDNNTVLVDLDGDLNTTGDWNLHFTIQDTYYQNRNKYLRQQNSGQAAEFSQGKTSRFTQSLREFSLDAELCQDGVTFLYLNATEILRVPAFAYICVS